MQPTLYARHETTTDADTIRNWKTVLGLRNARTLEPLPCDVVLYSDAAATQQYAVINWFSSSYPTRRNKWQRFNCVRFRLEWLPSVAAKAVQA